MQFYCDRNKLLFLKDCLLFLFYRGIEHCDSHVIRENLSTISVLRLIKILFYNLNLKNKRKFIAEVLLFSLQLHYETPHTKIYVHFNR